LTFISGGVKLKSMEHRDVTIFKDKLYSLQEVAKMLRVSERSIFRYIYSGRLKATKIGYWRIAGKDVGAFINDSEYKKTLVEIKKKKIKK